MVRRGLALAVGVLLLGCGSSDDTDVNNDTGNSNAVVSCGDGHLDPMEECDDGADNSDTVPNACRADCRQAHCGDGVVDDGEACDEGASNADTVPNVCRTDCSEPVCGDGLVDTTYGETCDDGNVTGGDGCSAGCLVEYCGNGAVESDEACDDGNTVSGDGCSADCQSDERCGNGITDLAAGEGCDCGDGTVPAPAGCNGPNSDAPDATCRPDCSIAGCGDGAIHDPEDCEGTDLNGMTCELLGFYGGTLGCSVLCRYDTSGCSGYCGDGAANGTELCDGNDLSGATCVDAGFYGGTLGCLPNCHYDLSLCSGICGDGAVNGTEVCDGNDFGGVACTDLGYYGGSLSCTGGCTQIDEAGCQGSCGDGLINGPEDCDGANQQGEFCVDVGFDAGALSCTAGCERDTTSCFLAGFPKETTGWDGWRGTWSISPTEAVVVGYYGYYRLMQNGVWGPLLTAPVGEDLNAVWGSSMSNLYAVGNGGTILHYNGASWSVMSAPTSVDLYGVWGSSATDVWAVGNSGEVLRLVGGNWTDVVSGTSADFHAVWGLSPTEIYLVGNGVFVRHNGSSGILSYPPYTLRDIWGTSATSLWAASNAGTMVHWDGASWTAHATPASSDLLAVWGDGPDFVVAVGYYGTLVVYDGRTWQQLATQAYGVLNDIHGVHRTDARVVGFDGIFHSDGLGWTPVSTSVGAAFASIHGAGGSIFVTGFLGQVERFDGTTWTNATIPGMGTISGVWAASASSAWAVGSGGNISHWDGSAWTAMTSGTSALLSGVWGASATDVFAVGNGGTIRRLVGGIWQGMTSGTIEDLRAVHGRSSTDVYAVGWGGEIRHWNGATWSGISSGTSNQLNSVWTAPGEDVVAVGRQGTIRRDAGAGFVADGSPTGEDLKDVICFAERCFAVGNAGTILYYDGNVWSPMRSGVTVDLYTIWGPAPDELYAGGVNGTLLRFNGALGASGASSVCSSPASAIQCGGSVSSDTTGGQTDVTTYGCAGWTESGPEHYYALTVPNAGSVTVDLTGMVSDLDLFVLGDTCDPTSDCLGSSGTVGNESVTFTAAAGTTYYLVVDGFGGASGPYTLTVSTCP